jgi:hypothetical protein
LLCVAIYRSQNEARSWARNRVNTERCHVAD